MANCIWPWVPPPEAFFLYCPVKALNEGIVVGSPDSTVPERCTLAPKHVTEPPPELRAIVGLDAGKLETSVGLTTSQKLVTELLANMFVVLNICPATVHINEGVQIHSLFGGWVY